MSVHINSQHFGSWNAYLVFPSIVQHEFSVFHFRSSHPVVGSQPHDAVTILVHGSHFAHLAIE